MMERKRRDEASLLQFIIQSYAAMLHDELKDFQSRE